MEAVRGIILSVVCAALICGILTDLSAKTSFSKLIRLSCSIFLAFTMIAPILRLRFPKWEAQKNQYLAEAQDAALAGENIRLRSIAGIKPGGGGRAGFRGSSRTGGGYRTRGL